MGKQRKLGELLVDAGLLEQEQLEIALARQKHSGARLGELLVQSGMISEARLMAFLVKHFRIPAIDLRRFRIDPKILQLIPEPIAIKYNVLPVCMAADQGRSFLLVALCDPTDLMLRDEVEFAAGRSMRAALASTDQLIQAVKFYYNGIGTSPAPENAPLSSTLSYGDIVRASREYLMHMANRRAQPAQNSGLDEQLELTRIPERSAPVPATSAASTEPSSDDMLRALVSLLLKRGLIERGELLAELQNLRRR